MNSIPLLAQRIDRIMAAIRRKHPLCRPEQEADFFSLPLSSNGQPDHKVVVWYPTQGCSWARKGGCTMCNFGRNDKNYSPAESLDIFDKMLSRIYPAIKKTYIGTGGSFLDDHENPRELRLGVLRRLERFPYLTCVGAETRPDFVTKENLTETIENLPAGVKEFILGFGLESSSDLISRVALNKGNVKEDYLRAIRVIKEVDRDFPHLNVTFETYVLLKPPFLSEWEAIDDAVRSVEWSFAAGAVNVVVFTNTVKKGTLCALLSNMDAEVPLRFCPPYLYSALEVLKILPPRLAVKTFIQGSISGITPQKQPRNCPYCSTLLSGTITAFNYYHDLALLTAASEFRCRCREEWMAELNTPLPPLSERIVGYLDRIEETQRREQIIEKVKKRLRATWAGLKRLKKNISRSRL